MNKVLSNGVAEQAVGHYGDAAAIINEHMAAMPISDPNYPEHLSRLAMAHRKLDLGLAASEAEEVYDRIVDHATSHEDGAHPHNHEPIAHSLVRMRQLPAAALNAGAVLETTAAAGRLARADESVVTLQQQKATELLGLSRRLLGPHGQEKSLAQFITTPPDQVWINGVARWGAESARQGRSLHAFAYALAGIMLGPVSESRYYIRDARELSLAERMIVRAKVIGRGVIGLGMAATALPGVRNTKIAKRTLDRMMPSI